MLKKTKNLPHIGKSSANKKKVTTVRKGHKNYNSLQTTCNFWILNNNNIISLQKLVNL